MTRWFRIRFASGYMASSLVGGLGSDFALVVGEAAQDQEAQQPGTGSILLSGNGFDLQHFIRSQADAQRLRSDALGSAPDFGYVFHNVMMCNRYRMA